MSSAPTHTSDPATELERVEEGCGELCDLALKSGAEQAEACGVRIESRSARFEKGELALGKATDGTTFGLRVFDAGRLGFCHTNQAEGQALEHTARDAVALAGITPPDDANALCDAQGEPTPIDLWRPETAALGVEDALTHGARFVAEMTGRDPRIRIDEATFTVGRSNSAISWSSTRRSRWLPAWRK